MVTTHGYLSSLLKSQKPEVRKKQTDMWKEREPQLSINQSCKYGMRMVNHSMRTAVDIG